ncbi:MAG: threonylcarbamoyl-AMP synthase [Candidatus Moranbacteria bacterium]|nr:threonylcarbamoyl-AMP synthase [Candidatus Moranbacteria bacterium]
MKNISQEEIIEKIKSGQIGVFPTDTLYAVSGSAFAKEAVRKIYEVKKRSRVKSLIILIGSIKDLDLFKIHPSEKENDILKKVWPGKVSVIFSFNEKSYDYLHCGTDSLALRLPDDPWLRSFLKRSGPIVAPSANLEGFPPAKTIAEAREYFKESVDFYFDKGKLDSKPSTIISLKNDRVTILRAGGEEEVRLAKSLEQS